MRFVLIAVGNMRADGTPIGTDASHGAMWPNLGILIVGSAIAESGIEVALHDENVLGAWDPNTTEVGDTVGLSTIVPCTERALSLARRAKEHGASWVILGNDQAAARARQILAQVPWVDAVCTDDDVDIIRVVARELALRKKIPDPFPGFASRNNGVIVNVEPTPLRSIAHFPTPKFALYKDEYWERVWSIHRAASGKEYESTSDIRASSILMAQGCAHGKLACEYCAIRNVSEMRRGDVAYLERVLAAYRSFGINSFFDVSDDLSGFGGLLRDLERLGVTFPNLTCYCRSFVTKVPGRLEMIRRLTTGRLKLNVGLDSGDDNLLRNSIRKGSGIVENRAMVEEMARHGIFGHFSFIFGAPGETRETCKKTLDFAEWACKTMGRFVANLEGDMWWVCHGSPSATVLDSYDAAVKYAALAGKHIARDVWQRDFHAYADEVTIPWGVQENWYRHFTHIDIPYANLCAHEMWRMGQTLSGAIIGRSLGGGLIGGEDKP